MSTAAATTQENSSANRSHEIHLNAEKTRQNSNQAKSENIQP